MIRLCWRTMSLPDGELQENYVAMGECRRVVMPRRCQYAWLHELFPERTLRGGDRWRLWLETDTSSFQAGSRTFRRNVTAMLHRRGAIANLSLRENLLLTFLYHGDEDALAQAEQELPEVTAFLGLTDHLDEQAGECSAYTHAVISLGRCILQHANIIVAQDVYCDMPPHCLHRFRQLFLQAVESLQAGFLYLSSCEQDGSEIIFDRTTGLKSMTEEAAE